MRTLTNAELISNAAAALKAGILAADVREKNPGYALGARYLQVANGDRYCVCAIGASLTPAEIAASGETQGGSCGTASLVSKKVVAFDDQSFADALQSAHDGWLRCDDERQYNKRRFFKMLGLVLPEALALARTLNDLFQAPNAIEQLSSLPDLGIDRASLEQAASRISQFVDKHAAQ